MKNVSFILQKKPHGLFGQHNSIRVLASTSLTYQDLLAGPHRCHTLLSH